MAKTSGLGDQFYIGGFDLSGDVSSLDRVSGGPATIDVTAINKSAHERIGGLRDGDLAFTSFFNTAAGQEHLALKTLPRTDTVATYFRGSTVGNPSFSVNGKQVNYDPTRDNAGNLTVKVEVQANGFGGEWGILLTPGLRTDTTATTGTAFDGTGATSFGGQAYFQVLSVVGTSVTIDIQSATTSGGSYSTTGLTSSAVTSAAAPAVQRVSVANTTTINEFLKVVTTGTFTSAVFAVCFIRNYTAGVVF